jgi:hypothetical protein
VIARHGEHGYVEAPQHACRRLELLSQAAVGEVAARDDQLRPDAVDERPERALDLRVLPRAEVEIRHVQDAGDGGQLRSAGGRNERRTGEAG